MHISKSRHLLIIERLSYHEQSNENFDQFEKLTNDHFFMQISSTFIQILVNLVQHVPSRLPLLVYSIPYV